MNQGELTKDLRENAVLNLYQNQGYITERVTRKSLILVIESDACAGFKIDLQEPLHLDKLSDMYLDSFTTVNCTVGAETESAGFILKLDPFNINTAAGSTDNITGSFLFNSVFIPNESRSLGQTVSHKSKKFNYICNVNPSKIFNVTGSITNLSGTSPFGAESGRIIVELVLISQ